MNAYTFAYLHPRAQELALARYWREYLTDKEALDESYPVPKVLRNLPFELDPNMSHIARRIAHRLPWLYAVTGERIA